MFLTISFLELVFPNTVISTPPSYSTFGRDQRINYSPKKNDLMRIWIVYVGQGDGILIQLPPKYDYDPNPEDSVDEKTEHVDIMIDGGSFSSKNKTKMLDFLQSLYSFKPLIIEHTIITHHDLDHIRGLISILKEPSITVHNIYQNGLASYRPTEKILKDIENSARAITKKSFGKIKQVMATLENDKETIKEDYLIEGFDQLKNKYNQNILHGIYEDLAQAIIDKDEPQTVNDFLRVWEGSKFIDEYEKSIRTGTDDIEIKVIWPQQKLKAYENWSQTVNGNSVTFRIKYHNFEMLFTGDQNELSEKAVLEHLRKKNNEDLLNCDVLKVPHHGSNHNLEEFIVSGQTRPILSVASMGPKGFSTSWKHPSTKVIKWTGGAHRFYSTYIHERKFNWDDMKEEKKRLKMIEKKHILIETDGEWFRLVEVDNLATDLNNPPTIKQTRRGNGTRWIKAN